MTRPWLAAYITLALAACSGNSTPPGHGAVGGRANATEDSAGALETPESAGNNSESEGGALDSLAGAAGEAPEVTSSHPSDGSSGRASASSNDEEAGAAGAPSPVIPSGTQLCNEADDCVAPDECRGRASSSIRVCLKGCASDADCSPTHRCVLPSDPLGPDSAGCMLRCEVSPLICPYALDCYDLSGQRDYTCLPRQW